MKSIHAVWEQRNLGVDAWEIQVEPGDTVELLQKELTQHETQYTVVKVAPGLFEINEFLARAGYTFIETMINCHHDAKMPVLSRIEQRIVDSVTYEKMTPEDVEVMYQNIENGMFKTDRIAMDPYFTKQQARHRYKCWLEDETKKGADLYKMIHEGVSVGFFIFKDCGGGCYSPFLGGIYEGQSIAGMGLSMLCCHIKETIHRGGRRILWSFSSNNRGSAAIHMRTGYVLDQISTVFVKHN